MFVPIFGPVAVRGVGAHRGDNLSVRVPCVPARIGDRMSVYDDRFVKASRNAEEAQQRALEITERIQEVVRLAVEFELVAMG